MGNEIKLFEHAGNLPRDKREIAKMSKKYPEFTERGVELAIEKAEELAVEIEKAEKGTIIWLGGNSYIPRSRATQKIFSDVLRERFQNSSKNDILFFSQEEIQKIASKKSKKEGDKEGAGYTSVIKKITNDAKEYSEAKVVIDMPLIIKQISQKDWYVADGKFKKYQERLLKDFDLSSEYSENYTKATKKWFRSPDTEGDNKRAPSPEEVAESYLQGLQRLINFTRKYAPDRPIKIVVVGHSFEINALLTFLANEGKVSEKGFDKIGGSTIGFTESATIEIKNNKIRTSFREKDFEFEIPRTN
jgi:hypothetical protein